MSTRAGNEMGKDLEGCKKEMKSAMQPNQSEEDVSASSTPVLHKNMKEWHLTVTKELRNPFAQKISMTVFPDPNAFSDPNMSSLMTYAREEEAASFEKANDREEYYHLLAEKIYKIEKKQEERKNKPPYTFPTDKWEEFNTSSPILFLILRFGIAPEGLELLTFRKYPLREAMPSKKQVVAVQSTAQALKIEAEEIERNATDAEDSCQ